MDDKTRQDLDEAHDLAAELVVVLHRVRSQLDQKHSSATVVRYATTKAEVALHALSELMNEEPTRAYTVKR